MMMMMMEWIANRQDFWWMGINLTITSCIRATLPTLWGWSHRTGVWAPCVRQPEAQRAQAFCRDGCVCRLQISDGWVIQESCYWLAYWTSLCLDLAMYFIFLCTFDFRMNGNWCKWCTCQTAGSKTKAGADFSRAPLVKAKGPKSPDFLQANPPSPETSNATARRWGRARILLIEFGRCRMPGKLENTFELSFINRKASMFVLFVNGRGFYKQPNGLWHVMML